MCIRDRSISADVPENTATLTVCCMIRYASGTAWFDCLQLEYGGCANDYNALLNGDFSSNDYWYNQENKPISAENGTVTLLSLIHIWFNGYFVKHNCRNKCSGRTFFSQFTFFAFINFLSSFSCVTHIC